MATASELQAAFCNFVAAVKNKLLTTMVNANTTLSAGGRYFVKGDHILTLPYVGDRDSDTVIHLNKAVGATPVIRRNPADTTVLIHVSGSSDSDVTYDVSRPIVVVFDFANNKWII